MASDGNTCMELALEGERLCKGGDCKAGVAFFEGALQAGTEDLKTLSAIYSQLGNAYFYLRDYAKALEYHKNDLQLARSMSDRLGEAKASGNLGNTLKVLGKYDEAILCCRRHLDISSELGDKIGEGRALYNLGNVYHAKGKHIGRLGHQDPGEFPEEVRVCLEKAVDYYKANLQLMIELQDRSAQGRACGNLGNTYYLLGNFGQAIVYHEERLKIAKEFGDKAAERRAHSNLGNAHIFLGEFETAADQYKKTLALAQELGDRAIEAQACYSLGNTYTLLREYPTAVEFHLRHLGIAQELMDKIGEARACWSLGNAHSAIGNHDKALHYANKHLHLSKEIGDRAGQATAQMNLADLRKILGEQQHQQCSSSPSHKGSPADLDVMCQIHDPTPSKKTCARRVSMENLDLLKLTPEIKNERNAKISEFRNAVADAKKGDDSNAVTTTAAAAAVAAAQKQKQKQLPQSTSLPGPRKMDSVDVLTSDFGIDDDLFFELLCRFQGNRMDDQRCSLSILENKENHRSNSNSSIGSAPGNNTHSPSSASSMRYSTASVSDDNSMKIKEDLLDMIAGMQSKRLDEQRASLPGLNNNPAVPHNSHLLHQLSSDNENVPDDQFFDMLMRCQSTRLEDQRSFLPAEQIIKAPTVPDEDFFRLIVRFQSGRIEEQRSSIQVKGGSNVANSAEPASKPPLNHTMHTATASSGGSVKSRTHKSKREKH